MNLLRQQKWPLLLAGVVLVGIFAVSGSVVPASERADNEWSGVISAQGGKEAYGVFAQRVETLTPAEQHTQAHYFGTALYEAEGIPALGVCDARFSYGCFHEFLGKAIAEHGLQVVPQLNEGCRAALVESPLSCQHGIGHGVVAYLGYSDEAFIEALEECRVLPYNDPIGGCYGGVFMEYNLQTMLGTQARLRQPTEGAEGAYEPCKGLSLEYAQACVFWQPQWWHTALLDQRSDELAFERMGELCVGMTAGSPILRRGCFEGIGNIVPPTVGFEPKAAALLCDAAGVDDLSRLQCRSLAANSLTVGGSGRQGNGRAVCEGLAGEALEYCDAYARNRANILEVLPPPRL
jgi:hypothetical protein